MSGQPNISEILRIHKAIHGSARMETETPPEPTGAPPAGDPPKTDEKQLPQSQVNDIVATRTKEAREKAYEDLAKELGVPIADAKRIVKERQDADEKNRSDLEREQTARTAAERDRDEKVSTSQTELHQERSDRALVAAGVPDEDAKLERLRGMLTVPVGATRDEIKKDVEKLKTDFPALFVNSATTPPGTRRQSTDPPKGPGQHTTTDAMQRGLDRAKTQYEAPGGVPRPVIPGLPT